MIIDYCSSAYLIYIYIYIYIYSDRQVKKHISQWLDDTLCSITNESEACEGAKDRSEREKRN